MALRTKTAIGALLTASLWAAPGELRFPARHDHLRKGGAGVLIVGPAGISFKETARHKHPHAWEWAWQNIQQLTLAPRRITVLTYQDNRWRMGADREYRFDLVSGGDFREAYEMLKNRLDQRLVAALPDPAAVLLWEIPAKHLLRFGGSHGVLMAGRDALVYKSDRKGESRTWRYGDIENVSTSGPFQLTITTYERARTHYGSLKGFNFQLKEPLREARYNDLWRRIFEEKQKP